jgi:hypothetical protein
MKKEKRKTGLGPRITSTLIEAGTGAVINVAESAIGKSDMLNYGMLAAGAFLPAFVPGKVTEAFGGGLAAVAGYRIAESFGLGNTVTGLATNGLGERSMIGNARSHFRKMSEYKKNSEGKEIDKKMSTMS